MGEGPDLAGFVTGQLQHLVQGQPVLERVGNKSPLVISRHPVGLRTSPQFAGLSAVQRVEPISHDSRGVGPIEYGKVDAVETNQTIQGRKPQVSIRYLADITRNVLRQTVIGCPVIDLVLGPASGPRQEDEQPQAEKRSAVKSGGLSIFDDGASHFSSSFVCGKAA
jgi:hypothetical protein